MGKWRENAEMGKDSLSIFPHFLFISSLSINSYVTNFHIFHEMLNTALKLQISQKNFVLMRTQ